ncbi:MAG: protein-L-isoaspartate(D-aspartate) O-methyltransferase [Paucibacter sp.]|nr:protein-L-isoaspartate(D-aspartate) O-methyltransferase [Roseateles sp.]
MSEKSRRFPLPLEKVGKSPNAPARSVLMPQRHLREAALDAQRSAAPVGLGLDSAQVRARMVQRLRAEGLSDERVLDAFGHVPRHAFVDSALAIQAYEDTALPIGLGQTISKPSVVGRMLALLMQAQGARARGHLGKVLEIGTGCGYQAALLAQLGQAVVTVERLRLLYERALSNLEAIGMATRARLVFADGMLGHAPGAPYDSIVAAAGGEDIPSAWLEQLAPGGRLVAPMAVPGANTQVLVVIDHQSVGGASHFIRSEHEGVLFVPLKSGVV